MFYRIEDLDPRINAGGKAEGLAFLKQHAFTIPETYVLTGTGPDATAQLADHISENNFYAVRSSASDEDRSGSSFAGQYDTLLNVKGMKQILEAVQSCLKSLHNKRSDIYRKKHGLDRETTMSVIIQEMVDVDCAGVLFTVDAPGQRYDRMVISTVRGSGEKLVGGQANGETIYKYRHSQHLPESDLLKPGQITELLEVAEKIESLKNEPVDIEWAIDKKGILFLLQVRPVTALKEEHLNELDHAPAFDQPVYTRGNIGEMMPGPVTPLTLSVFGKAIDLGLQYFYRHIGAIEKAEPDRFMFLHSYYNHLFFDMMALYQFTQKVALTEKENIELSIAGETIPRVEIIRKTRKGPVAWWNFIKLTVLLLRAPAYQRKLVRLSSGSSIRSYEDCKSQWKEIDKKLWDLFDVYYYHYITSAQSGTYYITVGQIMAGGTIPGKNEQEMIAPLLTSISGIKSAEALLDLNKLALCIADLYPGFVHMPFEKALKFLNEDAPDVIRELYKKFLQDHGHRSVKEAELRTLAWIDDQKKIIPVLQEKAKYGKSIQTFQQDDSFRTYLSDLKNKLSRGQYLAVKYFTPRLRKAVSRREFTKSASIKFQRKFRMAYLELANLMVRDGLLDDSDQVFFLTHEEIGRAIDDRDPRWKGKAAARRDLQDAFEALSFPDISFGIPVPEPEHVSFEPGDLSGIPVSKGVLKGRVRIVEKLEDAEALQKGEIMVARFTDVGWTPYFGIAGGIITEIGSPISHGAVVAREYGIPAVVSVKGAMQALSTGQYIELDGLKGSIKVMSPVEVTA